MTTLQELLARVEGADRILKSRPCIFCRKVIAPLYDDEDGQLYQCTGCRGCFSIKAKDQP